MTTDSFVPNSSYLALVEYSEADKRMTITFKTGAQHVYLFVYKPTFDSFKTSPSHGVFYAKAIRGKLKSVPIIGKKIGLKKSTPLHKLKIERGLQNGQRKSGPTRSGLNFGLERVLRGSGLIPSKLREKGRTSSNTGIA
jgi:KTSC domain